MIWRCESSSLIFSHIAPGVLCGLMGSFPGFESLYDLQTTRPRIRVKLDLSDSPSPADVVERQELAKVTARGTNHLSEFAQALLCLISGSQLVLLSVERHTLWRWIKAGKLQAQKVGGVVFIEKKAVEALRKAAQNSTAGEAA